MVCSRFGFLQAGFVSMIQSAAYDVVFVGKCNLTGGDAAHLQGYPLIDFIADHQVSEDSVLGGRTKINRLEKNLIEVFRAKPPPLLSFQRSSKGSLSHLASEA